ncbi:MAG: hypothetical protein U5K79_23405 [Cyclobacteriaceae bacterium]|nr:hypothetical protein [Cyclobacteriaceae bacterium]
MRIRHFLLLLMVALAPHLAFAHTIDSSLGHSYSTVFVVVYFLARILPFVGLGIMAKYPARQMGYLKFSWQFIAMLGAGIVLGYHFHDYLSTAYFNYFLIVAFGFLMYFNSGKHPAAIRSMILISCLPLGFDFGSHFSHADAWLGYMISILVTAIATFMGLSRLFIQLHDRYQWVQQMAGILLIIAGFLLILLF